MQMVFFSSDGLEVTLARREMQQAGISCEIRCEIFAEGRFPSLAYAELWVHRDQDTSRALSLCAELSGWSNRRAA
jgi:hypothetical protein